MNGMEIELEDKLGELAELKKTLEWTLGKIAELEDEIAEIKLELE